MRDFHTRKVQCLVKVRSLLLHMAFFLFYRDNDHIRDVLPQMAPLLEVDRLLMRGIIWLFSGTPRCLQFILENDTIGGCADPEVVCAGLEQVCTSMDINNKQQTKVKQLFI